MTLSHRIRPLTSRFAVGRGHDRAAGRLTVAVVAVLVLAAAGCGSSDGSDGSSSEGGPTQSSSAADGQELSAWADDVCSAASEWVTAVDAAQTTLSDKANLSANGVRSALDGVATATDSLVTDLTGLGPPDTAAGDQAQAALSALATQLRQQQDEIAGATSQSPTTAGELLTNVSTITGALATMVTGAAATMESIRQLDGAEELESAFKANPNCQQLPAIANGSPGS
jgi:hypothetical protein